MTKKRRVFAHLIVLLIVLLSAFWGNSKTWADGGIIVTIEKSDAYNDICQYKIEIANETAEPLEGWSLALPIKPGYSCDDCWNCTVSVSEDGTVMVVSSLEADWNRIIQPGTTLNSIGIKLKSGGVDAFSGTYDYNPESGVLTKISQEETQAPTEESSEETTQAPTEEPTEETTQAPTEESTEATTQAPAEETTTAAPQPSAEETQAQESSEAPQPTTAVEESSTEAAETTTEEEPTQPSSAEEPTQPSTEPTQPAETTAGSNEQPFPGGTGMYGALTLNGTQLCNTVGTPVQLRGISTHGIFWFPEYINQETFRSLRDDWGANLIRLAMYTAEKGGYCNGGDKAYLESLIDKGVQACINLNMYCIIDWHILSDNNPQINKESAIDFFDRMSAKYANYNNVIYEICNEPNGCEWTPVKEYAEEVIPVIRKNAPHAIIIVGTTTWSQDVDIAAQWPVNCPYNVMYAVHFYAASHGYWNRSKVTTALEKGLPVFVSEFSTCDSSGNGAINYSEASEWRDLIMDNNLSYAGWNLSNKAESSALIVSGCTKLSGWSDSEISDTGKWLKSLIKEGKAIEPETVAPTTAAPTYTVSYNANGGEGEMASQTLDIGTQITIPASGFSRNSYSFLGWNACRASDGAWYCGDSGWLSETQAASVGKALLSEGAVLAGATETDGDTITLYAVWEEYAVPRSISASFNGNIRLNFYISIPEALKEGAYALFTVGGETTKVSVAGEYYASDINSYKLSVNLVAAQIDDTVNVKLYNADGSLITMKSEDGSYDYTEKGVESSLQYYVTYLTANGETEELRELAAAAKDYCYAAKNYFKNTSIELRSVVSAVTDEELSEYGIVLEGTAPEGVAVSSISAMIESDNSIRIYLTFTDAEPDSFTYQIDGKAATLRQRSDGYYYLTVTNVAAAELHLPHVFSISDGENEVRVTASVLTYAKMAVENAADKPIGVLCKALYLYNRAAVDYFKK